MKPLNALIRRVGNDPKGSGNGESSRERGSQALATGRGLRIRPVFGFETEPSGEPEIERVSVGLSRGIEGAGRER
jgi:hypothetical protein